MKEFFCLLLIEYEIFVIKKKDPQQERKKISTVMMKRRLFRRFTSHFGVAIRV